MPLVFIDAHLAATNCYASLSELPQHRQLRGGDEVKPDFSQLAVSRVGISTWQTWGDGVVVLVPSTPRNFKITLKWKGKFIGTRHHLSGQPSHIPIWGKFGKSSTWDMFGYVSWFPSIPSASWHEAFRLARWRNSRANRHHGRTWNDARGFLPAFLGCFPQKKYTIWPPKVLRI